MSDSCNSSELNGTDSTSSTDFNSDNAEDGKVKESVKVVKKEKPKKKKINKCGNVALSLAGIISLGLGILTIKFQLFNVFMSERLKMSPGLPAYEWWKTPEAEIKLRLFIFNVTNSNEFLSGKDKKLNVQEIGPLHFREHLEHVDIVFHNDSTMSYTAKRTAEYIHHRNIEGILDQKIIVPNLGSLGLASYLYDASVVTKYLFNLLMRRMKQKPFIETTVHNYLFNMTSPVIGMAKKIVPFLVPTDNLGVISNIYDNFTDRMTVNIGEAHGNEGFFLLNKFHDIEQLPGFERSSCKNTITNATEGALYPQFLTKKSVLKYWRKTLCKVTPLYYDSEVQKGDLLCYKYILPNNTYDRKENISEDCYTGVPSLPSGLSDLSKCFFNFPIAASFPHMYTGGQEEMQKVRDKISGLRPNVEDHGSYIIAEPTTGVPTDQCARSQSNLVVNKLQGFDSDIVKLSQTVIPMFWAEYHLQKLPSKITVFLVFAANYLPVLQFVIPVIFFIIFAIVFIVVYRRLYITSYIKIKKFKSSKNNCKNFIRANTGLYFEKEAFLISNFR